MYECKVLFAQSSACFLTLCTRIKCSQQSAKYWNLNGSYIRVDIWYLAHFIYTHIYNVQQKGLNWDTCDNPKLWSFVTHFSCFIREKRLMTHHVTIHASHLITLESNFVLCSFLLSITYGHYFNSQQLVATLCQLVQHVNRSHSPSHPHIWHSTDVKWQTTVVTQNKLLVPASWLY
jgi:hypothetical protein